MPSRRRLAMATQAGLDRGTLRSILFADLEQYSRLAAANELDTLNIITRCFELFQAHCDAFGAEFIKTTGDGVLILFDSVTSAIDYAMSMQDRLAALGAERPVFGRFRIGLHMGEVHRRDGDALGHAVNVAARVQTHAEPGGVCATQEVYWAARSATRFGFRFAGRPALKNIPEPIALYHIVAGQTTNTADPGKQRHVLVIDGLVLHDGDGEPIPLRSRKAQALIGYLALSSQLQDVQDRIAALIWPDRTPAAARHALANCLQAVDKTTVGISSKTLFRRGRLIGLSPSQVTVDVVRLLGDLSEGKISDLLLNRSDWADAILFGLEDVSALFNAWLRVTRHNWRDHVLEALENMLDRFSVTEPALRRATTALLILEPSHERAARYLIRHHAETHNLAAAIRVFDRLSEILRERYQMTPSAETTALIASLRRPESAPAGQLPPRRRGGPTPTLAVGRFRARNKSISLLASGFRSELIANLSKFREFTVVELEDGASSPDVDYVLSAECTDAVEDVKLFVTLGEPGTRRVVWSDSFQLSLESWLSLQKQLVGRIASSLEVYLSHDRLSRDLQRLPQDLGVYDAWLRGEDLLTRWSPSAEDEAERLFENAIAADPNFAPAHASLASVYNSRQFIRPGIPTDPTSANRALELAQRAVELDPLDARNHLVVAWSTAMARRFEQSEVHYELGAELNPNSPKTLVSASPSWGASTKQNASWSERRP
jgi:class 3 adenylate cyclase/DNA-binding SARP family transcriptional activator/TolB-like protein